MCIRDRDDNNLELPVIRGLSEPIDLESKPVPPDPDGPRFPKDDQGRPALRRSGTKTDSQKS